MIAAQWTYVLSAWAVSGVVIIGYAVSVIRRGKQLSKSVPPEDRRWM